MTHGGGGRWGRDNGDGLLARGAGGPGDRRHTRGIRGGVAGVGRGSADGLVVGAVGAGEGAEEGEALGLPDCQEGPAQRHPLGGGAGRMGADGGGGQKQ